MSKYEDNLSKLSEEIGIAVYSMRDTGPVKGQIDGKAIWDMIAKMCLYRESKAARRYFLLGTQKERNKAPEATNPQEEIDDILIERGLIPPQTQTT